MRFEFKINRAIIGNDIDIKISGNGLFITAVESELDGLFLERDEFDTPLSYLERSFSQVGVWSPNDTHRLIVTVTDHEGENHVGAKIFVDGGAI